MKKWRILLFLVAVALLPRLWGINFGLPFHTHPDEPLIMDHIQHYLQTRDFQPPDFLYPPLQPYLQTTFLSLLFSFIKGASTLDLYLLNRGWVAICGGLTVIPIYLLAKEITNRRTALWAGLIFSGLFINVFPSHYLKNEVPLTFFGAWILLFSTRILRGGKTKDYVLSGAFSALGLMTHYNGVLFLTAPLLAHLSRVRHRQTRLFSKNILPTLGVFLAASFAASPYYFLALKKTAEQIWQVYSNPATYPLCTSRADGIPTPIWYFLYLLTSGLFYPTFLACVGGAYLAFKHQEKNLKHLLVFAGLYVLIFSLPPHRIDRYLTPLSPIFAITAAYFLSRLNRKVYQISGLVLVILLPYFRSLAFAHSIAQPDTRLTATDWVMENLPRTATINCFGNSTHVCAFLSENGFNHTHNAEKLDLSLLPDGYTIVSQANFYISRNYRRLPDFNREYQEFIKLKTAVTPTRVFSNNLFEWGLFSPHFLEHSSTVNHYHNPTIEIYPPQPR